MHPLAKVLHTARKGREIFLGKLKLFHFPLFFIYILPSPSLSQSGIVESVLAWSKFKQDLDMKKAHTSKKTSKLRGVSKLEDANDAGTKNSIDCTLILTEGDSAKTLAVAGLSVIGRSEKLNFFLCLNISKTNLLSQGQVRRVPAQG